VNFGAIISRAPSWNNQIQRVSSLVPLPDPHQVFAVVCPPWLNFRRRVPILQVQTERISTSEVPVTRFIPAALTVVAVLATAIVAVGPWMWG